MTACFTDRFFSDSAVPSSRDKLNSVLIAALGRQTSSSAAVSANTALVTAVSTKSTKTLSQTQQDFWGDGRIALEEVTAHDGEIAIV